MKSYTLDFQRSVNIWCVSLDRRRPHRKIWIRMSFIEQVCLHIKGIYYSDRSSTVQQTDCNRTGHRQQKNNIQIGTVQNRKTQYTIQTIMCEVWHVQIWNEKKNIKFNVKCSWDVLPEGRHCFCVWSFWCSELCSVDQTVTVHRGSVLDVRVQRDFVSSFAQSGWVQFLESGEGCTNDSLSSPDDPP